MAAATTAIDRRHVGASSCASSVPRQSMLVEGTPSQVSCICSVEGRLAAFQIDSGSTFTQIVPDLAPQLVPRLGLGSASVLGRRVWFPTCSVNLAPVDPEGNVVVFGGASLKAAIPRSRVQIGSLNLLGLLELRRWRVLLDFGPASCSCSVALMELDDDPLSSCDGGQTVPLEDALRAAEVLNNGTVQAEEAISDQNPLRVDVAKVLEMSRARTMAPWWPLDSLALMMPQETATVSTHMQQPNMAPALQPHWQRQPNKASGIGVGMAVLFGTADALVSDTMLPPLLPPPLLAWPEVFFGTADALVSESMPLPLLPRA